MRKRSGRGEEDSPTVEDIQALKKQIERAQKSLAEHNARHQLLIEQHPMNGIETLTPEDLDNLIEQRREKLLQDEQEYQRLNDEFQRLYGKYFDHEAAT